MNWSRACSAFVACLFVSSLSPVALAQTNRDRAAARTAADAGADAFEAGRYDQALELFTRAEALLHAPPHLLFIARSQDKLGKLVEAHETYLKLAGEKLPPGAPTAFKNAQAKGEAELGAIEARLAYVTISVRGDEGNRAIVAMDNIELPSAMIGIPIPADPGAHVFSARTDRARSSEVSVTLREGAKQAVELSLTETIPLPAGAGAVAAGSTSNTPVGATPPPSDAGGAPASSGGSSQKLWGFVTIGAGAVFAGVGAGFMVSSSSARKDADELYDQYDCNNVKCTSDQQGEINEFDSKANTSRAIGITGFAAGGAAIITGLVLVLTDKGGSGSAWQKPAEPHVRFAAGPSWVGATGSF